MASASPLLLAALLAGSTLTACTRSAPASRPPDEPVVAVMRRDVPAAAPSLQIRLHPRREPTPQLGVELLARGIADVVWELPAMAGVEVVDLTLRDDMGDMTFTTGREGQVLRITLAGAAAGALRIAYTVRRSWDDVGAPEGSAALLLRIEREHMLAAGEQVLLLPAGSSVPVQVSVAALPAGAQRVATSLGITLPPRWCREIHASRSSSHSSAAGNQSSCATGRSARAAAPRHGSAARARTKGYARGDGAHSRRISSSSSA